MRIVEIRLSQDRFTSEQLERINSFVEKKDHLRFLNSFEEYVSSEMYLENGKIPEDKIEKLKAGYEEYKITLEPKRVKGYYLTLVVDLTEFMSVCYDITFNYLKTIKSFDGSSNDIKVKDVGLNVLTAMGKLEEINKNFDAAVRTFNSKVKVHIGGSLLLAINEVEVLEDYCTESLQSKLKSGWRILAVCVQPDGRRPDYVVGRTNDDY